MIHGAHVDEMADVFSAHSTRHAATPSTTEHIDPSGQAKS
jgi:hypothetical protein